MASQEQMVAKQLANILAATGKTLAAHVEEISATELEKHMEIVKYFKTAYAMGHGNANLLTHKIKQMSEGNMPNDDHLLAVQYSGAKSALEPMMHKLATHCEAMGHDVSKIIQKTGLSFRRHKQFALIQAPSAKRIQLSLNLSETPTDGRVQEYKGMCTHKTNLTTMDEIDDQVVGWIRDSYENC